MKIAFDYKVFYLQKYGGVSRYFISLAKEFIKLNEDIKIFSPIYINEYLKDNYFKNFRQGMHINKIPLNTRKLLFFYNSFFSKLLLMKWKPNVIHNTYYSENLVFNKKCLKVLTVYDLIHEIYYDDYNYNKNNFPKLKSLKNADLILCPSYKTKKDLINIYQISENKISVVYWGAEDFSNSNQVQIGDNIKPFLLYVGDRKRYKNFNNFIKAFSINKNLKQNFKVVCFGGDEFSKKEYDLFRKLDLPIEKIIRITGGDDMLVSLYKNAKAFIFPSKYEGLGLPPLESMKQGCPVIASNHEAIVEAVGNAAQLFDPNSIDDISDKIEEIIFSNEKTNKLINYGNLQVKKFTWSKCAMETLNLYKENI